MQDGKVSERDKELLIEINSLFQRRKSTYGRVRVVSAIKNENKTWKNVFTRFEILAKDDASKHDSAYDYGDFQIREGATTLEDFINTLNELVYNGQFRIPGFSATQIEGSLQKDSIQSWHYRSSNDQVFRVEWPFNLYMFQVAGNYKAAP